MDQIRTVVSRENLQGLEDIEKMVAARREILQKRKDGLDKPVVGKDLDEVRAYGELTRDILEGTRKEIQALREVVSKLAKKE